LPVLGDSPWVMNGPLSKSTGSLGPGRGRAQLQMRRLVAEPVPRRDRRLVRIDSLRDGVWGTAIDGEDDNRGQA